MTASDSGGVKIGPVFRAFAAYEHWADRFAEVTGKISQWVVIPTVAVGFTNVILRYVGQWRGIRLTNNAIIELQWVLYSWIFLWGFNYVLKHQINVRVDFWFTHRTRKTKARIDFWGNMVALLPFCVMGLWVSIPQVMTSWRQNEQSPDASGLPRAPIKTMIAVAFVLLLIQAIAEMVKLYAIVTGKDQFVEIEEAPEAPIRIE